MKMLVTLFVIFVCRMNSFSQTISYVMPDNFKDSISMQDYKNVADRALSIVSSRYKIDNLDKGTITLTAGQDLQAFNLDNVVIKCVDEKDHSKWGTIIQDHFNSLFSSIDALKKIDVNNYEAIRPYLTIRIYTDAAIEERGGSAGLVARIDLEGTASLLMLDLPQGFAPVLKKDFDLWHKAPADVFEEALRNVDKQKMEKMTKAFDVDRAQIEFNFLENEAYAASYALDLSNNSPELVGQWGSVVVIPNRGLVSVCKISKDKPVEFVRYIQRMKPLVEQSYSQTQYPVSKDFFWYYGGKFIRIPVTTDVNGNINVTAPLGLSSLIAANK